jgi:hypothetical protein
LACRVLVKIVYLLTCRVLGLAVLVFRSDLAKDAYQHRPHRFLNGAAPLKPLPEPVDLDLYRIRKYAQVGGLINEYHLVA